MGFSKQEYWSGLPCPAPGVFPNSGVGLKSPTWQVASLPSEALGEPKSTGVGSLSLLQQIFPSQESNRGLLHCRQILYQLSYQRSPIYFMHSINTYICQPQFPNSPHLFLSPLVSMHLISRSMSVFLLYKWDHLYHFSRFHIYVLIYMFFSLWLTSLCMTVSRSIHIFANDTILFLVIAE